MEFDTRFAVAAPIDEVWRAMLDLERVASCVPGARVIGRTEDGAYEVEIRLRLGPMSMTYGGEVRITSVDDAAHGATMSARAREARGQGTADATVELRLAQEDGRTDGTIHADVAISGKAAAMGQAVIADVSARLIATFAENLAAMLADAGVGEEPAAQAAEPGAGATQPTTPAPPAALGPRREAPAPRRAEPAPEPAEGLGVGALIGNVLAGRLRDPRIVAGLLAAAAAVAFVLGRRGAGRAR